MSNLGNGFKNTGSDPYNLRRYVKHLVDEGYDLSNPTVRNLIADKDWRTLYRYYDPRYLKNQEQ
jgi:hypothetical protein